MAEGDGDARLPEDDYEMIGGTTWTKDIRITHNSADDNLPQVVVDASDMAHIIWQRSGYWTKTFDKHGYALTKEIFITPHVVRGYGSPSRYPLGPQIAIDSTSNIHVVWDDGWQNVYYKKFESDANSLTQDIQVGNKDNTASHCPSIAIDPVNDHVHIVHEDYLYQCEDILYNKLDNDGKALINGVSVSADVSSHCEHSTLTTDQLGNIHVAFGSSTGAWWRKVDQNGVAQGLSVNLFSAPAYMITDLACTPNGDVHLVWMVDGAVRYTRMDNNGTKLDEDVVVSKNGTSPGPPRIAANHEDNTVHIVWHDSRDGNYEVYYAKMEEGSYNETPDNVRLTDDPAYSFFPRVAVSPGDSVHVVWQDNRDGNTEIYYKFMFTFKMELGPVTVAELASMFFFHPNEAKTLNLYLKNRGTIPDDYTVSVSYDDWTESDGWELYLNETEFDRVPGNSSVYFHLSMTSPTDANSGDYVNITITATSSSGETERLAWRAFIIVEKAVSLICKKPTKLLSPGDEVQFNLWIANIGDIPDTYKVDYTLIADDGWGVEIDKETVKLGVDESTNFTVNLTAPEDAKANDNGTVYIRVQSFTDASVWDGKKLLGIVDPDFHLEMEVVMPSLWVDPGGSVDFPITVRNVGNLPSKVEIGITSTKPRPGWHAHVSHETVFLAGGEEWAITLSVTAPADALAGSRQVIKVSSVTEDFSSRGSVEVSALVRPVHGIWPSIQHNEVSIHAGEEGEFLMTITNEGNGDEYVAFGSALVPSGWGITYELDGVRTQDLMLMAKDTKTIVIVVSTPSDAKAGKDNGLHVVLTDAAGIGYVIPIYLNILQRYAVDLSAPNPQGVGAPDGVVTYHLDISNEGNGEDVFALEHEGLPGPEWDANFYDADGSPVSSVTLAGGERRDIELRVHIPEDADLTEPVDLLVRATSTSAEVDEVKLTLNVRLPDLQILSIEYDPSTLTNEAPTHVTIQITNKGSSPAENVNVVMLDNDKELGREVVGTLVEGSIATVTFQWTPTPGKHTLTYRISTDVKEADYDNNELDHIKTVDDDTLAQDGFGMLAVVLALACVVVAARVRRKG